MILLFGVPKIGLLREQNCLEVLSFMNDFQLLIDVHVSGTRIRIDLSYKEVRTA